MSNIPIDLACFEHYPCMYLALLCEDVNEYDSNLELALRHTVDNVCTIAQLCHAQLLKDIGYLPPAPSSAILYNCLGNWTTDPNQGFAARQVLEMVVFPGNGRDAQFIAMTWLIVLGVHLDECLVRCELHSEVSRIDHARSAQNT